MNQSQPFSEQKIQQMIEEIRADGQNVTPWAVQAKLGGGDFLYIQQVVEQYFLDLKARADSQKEMSNQPATPAPVPAQEELAEDTAEQQMPAGIAASMYHMQTTLGQMANQLWTDAEKQVRGKLISAQQAHREVEQARDEALSANQQMQTTIDNLNNEMTQLNVEHEKATATLAADQQILQQSLQEAISQKDHLQKNVATLETQNRDLEQQVFNSNIETAKAEGVADIIKEQLELAKQSEKQLQKSLDRSEKKVKELNKELHDSSQSLREEMRERHIPSSPPKPRMPTPEEVNQQYPPQLLPEPSAAKITPATSQPAPIPMPTPAPVAQPMVNTDNSIQDHGHSLEIKRTPKATNSKTRSLTDKLFDRKKHPYKNKKH